MRNGTWTRKGITKSILACAAGLAVILLIVFGLAGSRQPADAGAPPASATADGVPPHLRPFVPAPPSPPGPHVPSPPSPPSPPGPPVPTPPHPGSFAPSPPTPPMRMPGW